MKLWGIFRFELVYQVRRIWPWLFFAVVLVLSFLMARDTSLADAMYEDFLVNSPFAIAKTIVLGSLFWLLVAPAIAGEAAARDLATGMHPLAYTVPVRKAEYLGGRLLAALTLNTAILLAVPAGILLAVYCPGVDPAAIGPFWPAAYLTAFAFISLPNALLATVLQFFLAERSGRAMASYVGSVFLVFMGFFVATLLNFMVAQGLGTLLDPIGLHFVIDDLAHDWTMIERNTRLVGLEGAVLRNRLLWLAVALALISLTYLRFRFAHRTETRAWWPLRRGPAAASPTPGVLAITASTPVAVPRVPRSSGFALHARRTGAIALDCFRTMATSWIGLALLAGIPLLTVLVVLDQMGSMGTALIPTTARVLMELTGGLSAEAAAEPSRWVILPLLLLFFAGELVWRERDAGLGEMADATPVSEWTPLLGKLFGLGLLLALLLALLAAAGMLAQAVLGYRNFEIGLYLTVLFGLQLPEYLLFAVLAFAVHVVVDQKYVGHLVAILAYAFIAVVAGMLGIEHKMLVYGASPSWSYTQMRGFGGSLGPWLWFKLYWVAWAVLLTVGMKLLWPRGRETGVGMRIRLARARLTRTTAWVGGTAALLVLALGGFVFYNTNVLNRYLGSAEAAERSAAYERRYARFARIPQPSLVGASLQVEIHPALRAVDVRGSYRLVNGSAVPIDAIHVTTAAGAVRTGAVTFDRAATLSVDDDAHGYRIYRLREPLGPGDPLRLDFEVHVQPHGFTNAGVSRSVVTEGTSFNGQAWFPFVGYQWSRELMSPADRRAHGLPPRPVIASLYEVEGREPAMRGGRIAFQAVVGTDADQVAVAPGALRRTWSQGGRRWFHYAADAAIGEEWGFFSARYAVRVARWKDVEIRIFHHPRHTRHLEHVMRAVAASLTHYTARFGPYPYHHLTVVEHAGAPGTGAHADPSMISHGEGFADWIPADDPGKLDMPFFVMAHEMAHQWTVPYALVEGLPFLSEGLANYFAMQLVRETGGEEQFRQLLTFMRQPYPFRPIRRGEPLLQALDPYLARRKGPFAMYALSEYVGEDRVNLAIRRLIEKHDAPGAPLATTLDLYRELQAVTPDAQRPLLHDLFEVNAIWQFRAEHVTARRTREGAWQVTLRVQARKIVYDARGVETEVPVDAWIPIGVFGPAQGGAGELSAPLYLQKHRVHSGAQTVTVTVPRQPILGGIDPYHLLDWEEGEENDENIAQVKAQ